MHYNKNDHYWIVDGSTTEVYSSAVAAYIPITDATFQGWLEVGNVPTKIIGNDMLLIRIQLLEDQQTPRRVREAGSDDASGTADGRAWMAYLDAQIEALRAQLAG